MDEKEDFIFTKDMAQLLTTHAISFGTFFKKFMISLEKSDDFDDFKKEFYKLIIQERWIDAVNETTHQIVEKSHPHLIKNKNSDEK